MDMDRIAAETQALQLHFRKRKSDPNYALEACINMVVTILMRRDGIGGLEANRRLSEYFKHVGNGTLSHPKQGLPIEEAKS
jgi:hypothetical protein